MIASWQRTFALCHKAWMESRAMFGACVFITFVNSWLAFDRTYEAVLAKRIDNIVSPFALLDGTYRVWGILFSVLGAGCPLWERRQGGLTFSLGLPVRLAHFNLIRAAVGFAQVAFVGSVPNFVAGWMHQGLRPELQVPIIPAFTVAGIALGLASFGLAYLVGSFLRNIYVAIGTGWLAAVAFSTLMARLPFTESLAGMTVLRNLGSLPPEPLDLFPIYAYSTIATLFVLAGAYIAESRSQLGDS